ncbi:hypothetical protein BDW75DRAFT_160892 [Aspergillus navahoensis]
MSSRVGKEREPRERVPCSVEYLEFAVCDRAQNSKSRHITLVIISSNDCPLTNGRQTGGELKATGAFGRLVQVRNSAVVQMGWPVFHLATLLSSQHTQPRWTTRRSRAIAMLSGLCTTSCALYCCGHGSDFEQNAVVSCAPRRERRDCLQLSCSLCG